MAKLNTPKGTRDFLPEQVARRNYIFQTVKDVFDTFGFSPIETPAMELKETLMGKYGEEGDRWNTEEPVQDWLLEMENKE